MIGIISAMKIEIEAINEMLQETTVEQVGSLTFTKGKLYGKDVVTCVCGIGKVFAAICAQTMILNYAPKAIVNVGVAGSLSSCVGIGDIAIAKSCVQHDMDTSPLGDPVGLISGINIINIPTDEKLSLIVAKCADSIGIKNVLGIIASGDCFVSSSEKKKYIKETFDAIACEMEGAAIAQACYVNKVRFALIRSISDEADGHSSMDYQQFIGIAVKNSSNVIKSLFKDFYNDIIS